ncbi:MAG: hemerythrin domain-containing protein [Rubellimicrobium sp.]|nr:hemerythrin domain-containing protein [Rubellimicrobium sp.]
MSATEPTDAVLDRILVRYHDKHREELAWLVSLSRTVEKVHAAHAEVPKGLGDLMAALHEDIEAEMQREEDEVFPLMRRGDAAALAGAVTRMRESHRRHAEGFARIRAATNGLHLPADACRTWTTLYEALATFGDDLRDHIALEDEVLLPRFAA